MPMLAAESICLYYCILYSFTCCWCLFASISLHLRNFMGDDVLLCLSNGVADICGKEHLYAKELPRLLGICQKSTHSKEEMHFLSSYLLGEAFEGTSNCQEKSAKYKTIHRNHLKPLYRNLHMLGATWGYSMLAAEDPKISSRDPGQR